jgi:hypothetical protein
MFTNTEESEVFLRVGFSSTRQKTGSKNWVLMWGNICRSSQMCNDNKKYNGRAPHGLYRCSCSQYWTIAHFHVLILQRCSLDAKKRREGWRKYGFIYTYQSLIQCLHHLYKQKFLSLSISNVQIHYSNLHKLPSKLITWLSRLVTNGFPFL